MKTMDIRRFQKTIKQFYKQHGRQLPWRKNINPYRILVSEIMLQQTQVGRVIEKYKTFLKKFPTFQALAAASTAEVLREWTGLGYNRRAVYLQRAAQMVIRQWNGTMSADQARLLLLPGVGRNTAGAIIVYAFNKPAVFIETNIRRVFIYHFFQDAKSVDDAQLVPIITAALDSQSPREWYWALMDYGTWLAKDTENPNRKSKQYVRQSAFEGSVRQARGRILRALLENNTLSLSALRARVSHPEFAKAMTGLAQDGLIVVRGKQVRLNT